MQLSVWEAVNMAYLLIAFPQTAPTDNAEKSPVSHMVLMCSKQYLHNTKREDLIKSTDVVPAKYLLKVKLELFTTLECQS